MNLFKLIQQSTAIYKKIFSQLTYDGLTVFLFTTLASINFFAFLSGLIDKDKIYLYIILNTVLSLIYITVGLFKKNAHRTKIVLLFLLILNFLAISFYYINYRKINRLSVQDGVIQMEIAADYLLQGKNPYSENYFETDFSRWHGSTSDSEKIAATPIYHYAYPPFSFIFSVPFYFIGQKLFGFYDQRILFLLLFLFSSFLIFKLPKEKNKKLLAIAFFSLNPFILIHLIYGSNNILTIFWMILLFYFIKSKKPLISSIILGLAIGIKQSIWFIIPFYLTYFFYKNNKKLIPTLKSIWPAIIIPIILFAPFLVWNYNNFIDDILMFPSGISKTSYPMEGIGLTGILLKLNVLKSSSDYFPSWIFQIVFSLPLLYYLLKKQAKNNSPELMYIYYLSFLFVFWFFSQYFHRDHLYYILILFMIIPIVSGKKQFKKF